MPIKFETTDPRGYKVVCHDWAWEHLTGDHAIMIGREDEVKRAIAEPTMGIYQDTEAEDRHIYYAFAAIKKRSYLKVVVQITKDAQTGRVITAYPAFNAKAGEKLLWPTSKA